MEVPFGSGGVGGGIQQQNGFGGEDAVVLSPFEGDPVHEAMQFVDDNIAYLEAVKRCPQVVLSESPPWEYLKFCRHNAWDAAKRLSMYWSMRVSVFGRSAFLPLQDMLTSEDLDYIVDCASHYLVLPADQERRTVFFVDNTKLNVSEKDNGVMAPLHVRLRRAWFALQVMNFENIRKNNSKLSKDYDTIILTRISATANEQQSIADKEVAAFLSKGLSEAMLTRVCMSHFVINEFVPKASAAQRMMIESQLVPAVKKQVGDWLLKLPTQVHMGGTSEEIQLSLAEQGLLMENLPETIGGSWKDWAATVQRHIHVDAQLQPTPLGLSDDKQLVSSDMSSFLKTLMPPTSASSGNVVLQKNPMMMQQQPAPPLPPPQPMQQQQQLMQQNLFMLMQQQQQMQKQQMQQASSGGWLAPHQQQDFLKPVEQTSSDLLMTMGNSLAIHKQQQGFGFVPAQQKQMEGASAAAITAPAPTLSSSVGKPPVTTPAPASRATSTGSTSSSKTKKRKNSSTDDVKPEASKSDDSAAAAAMAGLSEHERKLQRLRQQNVVYSRRKRAKQKAAHENLIRQEGDLRVSNAKLKREEDRLTALLARARLVVAQENEKREKKEQQEKQLQQQQQMTMLLLQQQQQLGNNNGMGGVASASPMPFYAPSSMPQGGMGQPLRQPMAMPPLNNMDPFGSNNCNAIDMDAPNFANVFNQPQPLPMEPMAAALMGNNMNAMNGGHQQQSSFPTAADLSGLFEPDGYMNVQQQPWM